jgi:peptidoglycan/xylan/chitin deacetylase (PgdA/CDA1 family)
MSIAQVGKRLTNRYRRSLCALFARRPVALSRDRAVVSFSFDDFPRTALHNGGAILEERGWAGTFYAALGLLDRDGPAGRYFCEADLSELLSRGHELGCHTYDHCHAWCTAPSDYESSLAKNALRLRAVLPEAAFGSHSYPISVPRPATKAIVGRFFHCARGGEPRPNGALVDANYLDSIFIEKYRGDFAPIGRLIDKTVADRGWLILSTHDVSPYPSRFGCTPEFLSRIAQYVHDAKVRVLPVARAFSELSGSRS